MGKLATRRRLLLGSVLLIALAFFAFLELRLTLTGADQVAAVRRDFEATLGLRIEVSGPIEFRAFPRPHILATGVAVSDDNKAIAIDIPSLRASIALAPLLFGRLTIEDLRLTHPTGVLNVEALRERWPRDRDGVATLGQISRMPERIAVISGLVQIQDERPAVSGILSNLQLVVSGLPSGAVSFNGRSDWHGTPAEFSGQLDTVQSLRAERPTTGFVKIKSRDLSLSLSGTLAAGWRGQFTGVAAGSTPSLATALKLGGWPTLGAGEVEHASFSGPVEQTEDGLVFPNARLVLNKTALEGTLAFQHNGGLVGTLATEALDLTPFMAGVPAAVGTDGMWNSSAFESAFKAMRDVDIRVSASQLQIGKFEADDAALSALCRNGHLELSLGEARAYGGLVKARLLASPVDQAMQIRLEASASRLDLEEMNELMRLEPGRIKGWANASLMVEGRGDSLQALIASSHGRGQLGIRQGRATGIPRMAGLLKPPIAPANDPGTAIFDLVTASGDIKGGTVYVRDGSIEKSSEKLTLAGELSLLDRSYHLSVAKPPLDEGLSDLKAGAVLGSRTAVTGGLSAQDRVREPFTAGGTDAFYP